MEALDRVIRRHDWFMRRRDLLALGYTDAQLRAALARREIFRVRQGWYSVPDAPQAAISAVRVGGRLTGVSALESYGLRVPRRPFIEIAVPAHARRLRSPDDRRRLLGRDGRVVIHWTDDRPRARGSPWRVSEDDALLSVLKHESRDIAVACASAVMRYKDWSQERLESVFTRAPLRVCGWLPLVSALDDAHGETFARLWAGDAGLPWESQVYVKGAGWLDAQIGPNTYVEIDGGQHDPEWTGEGESTYEHDHDRDAVVIADGGQVLRWTYRQLYTAWDECLAAARRALADDLELTARRARHPVPRTPRPPRASRTTLRSGASPALLKRRRPRATVALSSPMRV